MSTEMPEYMQPQWFIPMFAAMWCGITGLLSVLGGWATLAASYRAEGASDGERFRFVSGSLGTRFVPVNYGNCLFVTVRSHGIQLSILFPFRFLSPPLFLPWSHVESVRERRFLLLFRYAVIVVKDKWPRVSLYGRAGSAAHRSFIVFAESRSNKAIHATREDARA